MPSEVHDPKERRFPEGCRADIERKAHEGVELVLSQRHVDACIHSPDGGADVLTEQIETTRMAYSVTELNWLVGGASTAVDEVTEANGAMPERIVVKRRPESFPLTDEVYSGATYLSVGQGSIRRYSSTRRRVESDVHVIRMATNWRYSNKVVPRADRIVEKFSDTLLVTSQRLESTEKSRHIGRIARDIDGSMLSVERAGVISELTRHRQAHLTSFGADEGPLNLECRIQELISGHGDLRPQLIEPNFSAPSPAGKEDLACGAEHHACEESVLRAFDPAMAIRAFKG